MHRVAPHVHLKPDNAHIGPDQGFAHRLRNNGGIRLITPNQRRERPIAGAFFFGHGLHINRRSRLKPGAGQRIQGKQVRCKTRLHITGTATIKPVAIPMWLKGRRIPQGFGPRWHHIDMPVQNQGAPGLLPGPMRCNHVNGLVVIVRDWGKTGMVRDIITFNAPTIERITPLAISLEQEILAGAFLPSG